MAVEFAVFLPRTKSFNHSRSIIYALTHWLYTVAEIIVSARNNLKTMAGGNAVHERQAILSTSVVLSIHFVWRTRS